MAIFSLTATSSYAQWGVWKELPVTGVQGPYFLASSGTPRVGFACKIDGGIVRTTDGGNTWTDSYVEGQPRLMQILFKDSLVGWACGLKEVVKTTDGGVNWTRTSCSVQAPCGVYNSLYYNQRTHKLFASSWADGVSTTSLAVSSDDGSSWYSIWGLIGNSGFVMIDDSAGVLTTGLDGLDWARTTNGGTTWFRPHEMALESWQPCLVPGTQTMIAGHDQSDLVYRSTDAGESWTSIGRTGLGIYCGTMVPGSCGEIYTETGDRGLAVSWDLGEHWTPIGGPNQKVGGDDVLCVRGDFVFACGGEDSHMWCYVLNAEPHLTGGDFTLQSTCLSLDTSILLYPAACASADLSILSIDNPAVCQITDTNISSSGSLHVDPGQSQALRLRLTSRKIGLDTVRIRCRIAWKDKQNDTVLVVSVNTLAPAEPLSMSDSVLQTDLLTCSTYSHSVVLSASCDAVSIDSVWLVGGSKAHLQIGSGTKRRQIAAGTSDSVEILCDAGTVPGNISGTLHIRYSVAGKSADTVVAILIDVNALPTHIDYPRSVALDGVSTCTTEFTEETLVNPSCDSVEVTEIDLPRSPFIYAGPRAPFWIHGGDSVGFKVGYSSVAVRSAHDSLVFWLRSREFRDKLAVVDLTGSSIKKAPSIDADHWVLQPLSPCTQDEDTVVFVHNGSQCDTLDFVDVSADSSGWFRVDPLTLSTLPPLDSIPIHLHIRRAISSGVASAELRLRGNGIDTTLAVQVSVEPMNTRLLLSSSALAFKPRTVDCGSDTALVTWGPSSCEEPVLDSIIGVSAPFRTVDDSMAAASRVIRWEFKPSQTSLATDTVTVRYHYSDLVERDTALVLSGQGLPPVMLKVALGSGALTGAVTDTVGVPVFISGSPGSDSMLAATEHQVSLSVRMNTDLLSPYEVVATAPQAAVSNVAFKQGRVDFRLQAKPGYPYTGGIAAVQINCRPMISDSETTEIHLASSQTDDACIAVAVGDEGQTFTLRSQCGDDLIARLMATGTLNSLVISPNPSRDVLHVRSQSGLSLPVELEVDDLLGHVELQRTQSKVPLDLNIEQLRAGTHYLRIRSIAGNATWPFIIAR